MDFFFFLILIYFVAKNRVAMLELEADFTNGAKIAETLVTVDNSETNSW